MRQQARFIAVAGALAMIAGCGSSPRHQTARVVTAAPATGPCGQPAARVRNVTLRTFDGVRLAAAAAGSGTRGVVLVPEAGQTGSCGWFPFATQLAAQGFHVLAFDHRCQHDSACPASGSGNLLADIAAAATWLRQDGATGLALGGASQGGSEVLLAAARPDSGVGSLAALVTLSADELDQSLASGPGPQTGPQAAPKIHLPTFMAVASGDSYVSTADTTSMFNALATPQADKHLVMLPSGAGHGWAMLSDPSGNATPLATQIISFLAAVLR